MPFIRDPRDKVDELARRAAGQARAEARNLGESAVAGKRGPNASRHINSFEARLVGPPTLLSEKSSSIHVVHEDRTLQQLAGYDELNRERPTFIFSDKVIPFILRADSDDEPTLFTVQIIGLRSEEYRLASDLHGRLSERNNVPLSINPGTESTLRLSLYKEAEPDVPRSLGVIIRKVGVTAAGRPIQQRYIARRFQWLPQPRPDDFESVIEPSSLTFRPWTKQLRLRLRLINKSYMRVRTMPRLRVESRLNGLETEPQHRWFEASNTATVTIDQPARSAAVWICLLPTAGLRDAHALQECHGSGLAVAPEASNARFTFVPHDSGHVRGAS